MSNFGPAQRHSEQSFDGHGCRERRYLQIVDQGTQRNPIAYLPRYSRLKYLFSAVFDRRPGLISIAPLEHYARVINFRLSHTDCR